MVSVCPPVLDSVNDWAGLVVPVACNAKVSEAFDRMAVAGIALVPLSWIWLLPVTVSSSSVKRAERAPKAVGVKINPMKQLWPLCSGTEKLQVVVLGSTAKSLPDVGLT